MSIEGWLLLATALLAVVALTAAVVAVRAVRSLRAEAARPVEPPPTAVVPARVEPATEPVRPIRPTEVVDGRVVALVTADDLVEARLSSPSVQLSIYARGVAHALRPESRDRIVALVRREYRRRRRARLRVARRALRSVPVDAPPQQDFMGSTHLPQQLPRQAVNE